MLDPFAALTLTSIITSLNEQNRVLREGMATLQEKNTRLMDELREDITTMRAANVLIERVAALTAPEESSSVVEMQAAVSASEVARQMVGQ